MLLRHVVSYRPSVFFRGFSGMASSMSNTVETGTNEAANSSSKDVKPTEMYEINICNDHQARKKSDCWDLRRALASSQSRDVDLEYFTRQKQHKQAIKNTNTASKLDKGPKNAFEMYRSPCYPLRLFSWIYDPILSPVPSPPTTKDELIANLIAMRNTPAISLNSLIKYHEIFIPLQSSRSYDVLLELAVRHSATGTARKLLLSMNTRRIPFTNLTSALIMRLRIRTGHGATLFVQAAGKRHVEFCNSYQGRAIPRSPGYLYSNLMTEDVEGLLRGDVYGPLDVLIECLATPRRADPRTYKSAYLSAYRKEMRNIDYTTRTEQKNAKYDCIRKEYLRLKALPAKNFVPQALPLPTEVLSRLRKGLRHRGIQPQYMSHLYVLLIRRLLLLGNRQTAFDLAKSYIHALCAENHSVESNLSLKAFRIVNLFLHPKYGCSSIKAGFNTLTAFLHINKDLKPSATTLFVLLQNLRSARRRGSRAHDTLIRFRDQWGDGIEDGRVRRTVAKFALQEGSGRALRIAQEMALREARLGAKEGVLSGGLQDLRQPRPKPFTEIYTHKRREKEKWIQMGLVKRQPGFVVKMRAQIVRRNDSEDAVSAALERPGGAEI